MRIKHYTQRIVSSAADGGYIIVGDMKAAYEQYDSRTRSLTLGLPESPHEPNDAKRWEELASTIVADVATVFIDEGTNSPGPLPSDNEIWDEFNENCQSIIMGERPEWRLGQVCVACGSVNFQYYKLDVATRAILVDIWIDKCDVTIIVPHEDGAKEEYHIKITETSTYVYETIGKTYREIRFEPTNDNAISFIDLDIAEYEEA